MNVGDLISRTNVIAKKYEKYTKVKDESQAIKSSDPFTAMYTELLERTNELNLKAEEIAQEKNRATKAVLNAEQRKNKANLLEVEVPKLEKLVRKGKTTPEIIADREKKVAQVRDSVSGIADGVHPGRKPGSPSRLGKGQKGPAIEINAASGIGHKADNADYYTHSDETRAFQAEAEAAKRRQDKALDEIGNGVTALKGLGEAMGETVRNQDILLDAIDDRMEVALKDLRTNNMKLKGLVTKMGSGRNFCIDIILLCIVLAIALYIYNMVHG